MTIQPVFAPSRPKINPITSIPSNRATATTKKAAFELLSQLAKTH